VARLTKEERAQFLADWKAGQWSQNQLAKKYEVSPATANKICKGVEQDNTSIVNAQISIDSEMEEKSEYEVNSIHQAVEEERKKAEERAKKLSFYNSSITLNQATANIAMKEIHKEAQKKPSKAVESISAIESLSRTTQRNKEAELGKDPSVKVEVNNQQAIQIYIPENNRDKKD
jgi:hypothetical protein